MSDSLVNVTVEPKELVITLLDSSSTTVELNPNPVEVTINSAVQNTVTVTLGGGRGAVWLPDGGTYDGTALAAILAGHISKTQLASDLVEEIELTSTGLLEAQEDLQEAIDTLNTTGELVTATVSRMGIVEDNIVLQSSRLDGVESSITTARVDIDDNIIRLTAAETSLTDNSNYITTQQSILSNEWTVKIFENTDGTHCSAGIGLLVYPAWKVNSVYEIDDYCWFDDSVYKAKVLHTSSDSITPVNSSYWDLIPYGTKSQFGVLAETFFVQTQKNGNTYTPFVIYEDQVVINGDMIVNGLIKANYISANAISTWSIKSQNYIEGSTGYLLNAATGEVEFNNMTFTINYGDIVDAPDLTNYVTTAILNNNIAAIQAQIDGNFTIWYYPGTPTLSNEPAVNWTDNTLKDLHLGDQYYNETTGTVYRFKYESSAYFWFELPNTDLSLALASATTAQDTADNKRRVFVVQPIGPYDIGDLWVDGSIIKYANVARVTGYTLADWINTASLGAPIGTLIAGVSASDIATTHTNFNNSNDRNASSIILPTVANDGTCIDHTVRANGSVDISFEWLWSGTEGDIDGFQVLVYNSTSSSTYIIGSNVVNEIVYTVPSQKRVFILYGVVPNVYYTFAVRAYRSVDKDINTSGVITSNWVKSTYSEENPYLPSSSVAFSGNITGTVNNIPVANVNVWSAITGTGKPADSATKNNIYRQTTTPTGDSYTTGDLWIDTDRVPTTISQWDGSAWSIIGNYTTNTNQLTDGQNLGGTATWTGVTGTGKPSDNATKNTIYRQTTEPTGGTYTTGDLWYDTDANPIVLYNWNGTSWTIVANAVTNTNQITDGANLGSTAVWNLINGTGKPSDNATANTIYRQATEPTGGTYTTGDMWFNTGANPPALYNWNGSSWVVVSNTVTNTNQITDGANLGSTAIWGSISGTGKPADNADVTQTIIDNTLDTTTGGIIVRDTNAQRYAHLTGGDLDFYDLVESQWRLSKSVTDIRSGVCQNGTTVNIGYFRSQPTVILSPYNLQSYAAEYPSQSQSFKLEAANLRQSGVNWLFDAVAQLNLAAGVTSQAGGYDTSVLPATTGSGTIGSTIKTGKTVTIDVTPAAITLPINTRQVSVNLLLQQQYTFVYSINIFKVPVRVAISLQYLSEGNWVTGATASLAGVYCSTMVTRTISLSFTLGVDITQIRVIATFISDSGSTARYIDETTPIYNTMYAEILQVTTQQTSTVITATGYASYLAIG